MLQSTQLAQLSLIQHNMGAVHVAVQLSIIKHNMGIVAKQLNSIKCNTGIYQAYLGNIAVYKLVQLSIIKCDMGNVEEYTVSTIEPCQA